jgi:hypothetical protein
MTEIIQAIDNYSADYLSDYTLKNYGFCELMKKSSKGTEQLMPVTISTREQVSIDDRYEAITWVRWISPTSYENNEDFSFGKSEARVGSIPIRLVLAHKSELGEGIALGYVNSLPSKFTVSGYKFVFTSASLSVDPDHEAIVQAELGPELYAAYEKHRFTWNLYIVNINIQFLQCEVNA